VFRLYLSNTLCGSEFKVRYDCLIFAQPLLRIFILYVFLLSSSVFAYLIITKFHDRVSVLPFQKISFRIAAGGLALLAGYPHGLSSFLQANSRMPIPASARSKAWVWGCSLAEIVGSNPAMGI
jgi:hypothetical protein